MGLSQGHITLTIVCSFECSRNYCVANICFATVKAVFTNPNNTVLCLGTTSNHRNHCCRSWRSRPLQVRNFLSATGLEKHGRILYLRKICRRGDHHRKKTGRCGHHGHREESWPDWLFVCTATRNDWSYNLLGSGTSWKVGPGSETRWGSKTLAVLQ